MEHTTGARDREGIMTKGQRTSLILFALVGVMLVTINVSGQQGGDLPEVSRAALRATIATQEQYHAQLVSHPQVVGTGVSADASGRGVVKVYTTSADTRGLPRRLDGVPVVVQVTGQFVALQGRGNGGNPGNGGNGGNGGPPFDRTGRHRPSPIGTSVGHPDITAGTIGARVIDGSGNLYALSNNHVLANINLANILDPILQPGPFDGGVWPADRIGELAAYVPLRPEIFDVNIVDAAIARIDLAGGGEPQILNSTPPDGYGVPRTVPVAPAINMRVMKYGRTTGLTKARITDLNVFTIVQYGPDYFLWFDQQIMITGTGFSAGGDSGSLIVVEKGGNARSPVALLFAGGGSSTLANPIDVVLNALGVTIDGES